MELNKIEIVTDHKYLQIRELTDTGGYHRRVLSPDMDVSGEASEIQETAEKVWTNEVKDAYAKQKEEGEKNRPEFLRG